MKEKTTVIHLLICLCLFLGACQEVGSPNEPKEVGKAEIVIVKESANGIDVKVGAPRGSSGRMTVTVRGESKVQQSFLNNDSGPPWRKTFVLPANRHFNISATVRLPSGQRRFLSLRGKTREIDKRVLYEEKVAGPFLLSGDKLIFAAPTKELIAISKTDGSVFWKRENNQKPNLLLANEEIVFFTTEKTLNALATDDGRILWKLSLKEPPTLARFSRNLLFLFADGASILCIDKNGHVKWQRTDEGFSLPFAVSTLGMITVGRGFYANLVIDGPTGGRRGSFQLFALERLAAPPQFVGEELVAPLRNGKIVIGSPLHSPRIEVSMAEEIICFSATKRALFLASAKSLSCYDLMEEKETWTLNLEKTGVDALESSGELLVCRGENTLIVLETEKGRKLAELPIGGRFFALQQDEVFFKAREKGLCKVVIDH